MLATLCGVGRPAPELDDLWETLLLNQHHDTISATGLRTNVEAAIAQNRSVAVRASDASRLYLESIVDRIPHDPTDEAMLVAFNPLPHAVQTTVEYPLSVPAGHVPKVVDAGGAAVAAQIIAQDDPIYRDQNAPTCFVADLPAFGYAAYRVKGFSLAAPATLETSPPRIETATLTVELDERSGLPWGLRDARGAIALMQPRFAVFSDREDTWGSAGLSTYPEFGSFDLRSLRVVERGPVRTVVQGTYEFRNSSLVTHLELRNGERAVRLSIDADWNERFMRFALAFEYPGERAYYDIPFGVVERASAQMITPGIAFVARPRKPSGMIGIVSCGSHGFWASTTTMGVTLARSTAYSFLDSGYTVTELQDTGRRRLSLMVALCDDLPEIRRTADAFERAFPVLWNGVHDGSAAPRAGYVALPGSVTLAATRRVAGTIQARLHNLSEIPITPQGTSVHRPSTQGWMPTAFARCSCAASALMTSAQIKPAVFAAAVVAMALADRLDLLPLLATAIQLIAAALCLALVLIRPAREALAEGSHGSEPATNRVARRARRVVGVLLGWVRGAPGFAHDWKWPLDAAQSHGQLATLASIWLPWGSGAPAVQALGTYPITILGWVLGYVLPSNLALLAVLGCIGACAGVGTGILAARIGLPKPYQAVLALAIVAMPVWFNRLNAGHLEWLLAYALFPGALALAMRHGRTLRAAGGLGALWGIAGGQAQFLLFFPLAALPFVVRARTRAAAAVGVVLMIGLQFPAIAAMAYAAHINAFAQQRTNLTWQSAQSDPLALALVSGADAAHYFAHWQGGVAFVLAFGALILVAIGAFRNTLTRSLAVIWLFSAIWSSGLDGPLRWPMAWAFTHVPDAIALREFTHAQAITAPALAILAVTGVATIVRAGKAPSWAGAALAFLALLPLTFATFSGAITRMTPSATYSPEREAVVHDISALPQSGQVLWWPGLPPVSFANSRGGVDSEAFVTGPHAPYVEYRPTAALAQAIVALNAGDRAACGLLADLGIQAIVVRDGTIVPSGAAFSSLVVPNAPTMQRAGLREIATRGPYHLYGVPCYRGRFTFADDAAVTGDWSSIVPIARRRGATDELTN